MPARNVRETSNSLNAQRKATAIRKTVGGQQRGSRSPSPTSSSAAEERDSLQMGVIAQEQQREAPAAHQPQFPHMEAQPEAQTEAAMRHDSTESELPAGCVEGIPIAQGRPVLCVPDGGIELALMRSIKGDNYCFLRYMLVSGWVPRNPNACNFSITIERSNPQEMELFHVKDATPLHYAICCGSLKAVAVLIIAFPELVDLSCTVESSSESRGTCQSQWTTLDLASYFSNLYLNKEQSRHEAYSTLCVIILALQQSRHLLPFVNLPTTRDRLMAAGKNADEVIQAFVSATK